MRFEAVSPDIITRPDEYGNLDADLTEVTVLSKNKQKEAPPHKPLAEVVETVAKHQAAGFIPPTDSSIAQSGEKSSKNQGNIRWSVERT